VRSRLFGQEEVAVVPEATLRQIENGLVPEGEGWYVVNARDMRWWHSDLGSFTPFEGNVRFPQLGININVLPPGQPNCMYHAENRQEDFLVLSGECILIVEGEERRLEAWDFVHCPAGTLHVFVGAGDVPCVLLAAGARGPGGRLRYPVSEVARKYGAGAERETTEPDEAYSRFPMPIEGPYRHGDLLH
jgi:uncharacterized cupin superfamily protein